MEHDNAPPGLPTENDSSAEFLLHEFDREWNFFLSNEEAGDKRVTFLWTLTAALLAGFGALATSDKMGASENLEFLLAFGFLGSALVFVFGWQTFRRVLKRNISTDRAKRNLDKIRTYFLLRHSKIKSSLPYDPYKTPKPRRFKTSPFSSGGYAETVALLNSVLAGLACGLLGLLVCGALPQGRGPLTIGALVPFAFVGIVAMFFAWGIHARHAQKYYQRKQPAGPDMQGASKV
jgi:hypothetical protein